MTSSKPPIQARRPRLRWYLQLLRLYGARLLQLPTRERVSRLFAIVAAAAAVVALIVYEHAQPTVVAVAGQAPPAEAYIQLIYQLIVMVIAALISYALRPKPKDQEAIKASVPVVEDGKGIVEIFGTVWIEDPILLGFKQMGSIPIKAKGGKK
jgi:hypothetical protein